MPPPPLLLLGARPTARGDSCDGDGDGGRAGAAGPTTAAHRPTSSTMPVERAVLVRLGRMAGMHAVARAAVARLLMRADGTDAAAAFASSSSAAAQQRQQQPTTAAPPPHYARALLAELRSHPRVLDDGNPLAFLDDDDDPNNGRGHDEAEAERRTLLALEPPPPPPPSRALLREGVLLFHAGAREAQARGRLRALRSNDLGAYLALLRGTRDARLRECFAQTEEVLGRLLSRLPPSAVEAASAAARPARGVAGGGALGRGGADAHDDDEDEDEGARAIAAWERLATCIGEQEDVREQPASLGAAGGGGGEAGAAAGGQQAALRLRAYQMDGMRWMIGLKRLGLNGILADESGFWLCCLVLLGA